MYFPFERSGGSDFAEIAEGVGLFKRLNWTSMNLATSLSDDLTLPLSICDGTPAILSDNIEEAWKGLRPDVEHFLVKRGVRVSTGETMSDMLPNFKYFVFAPTAADTRFHFDQIPAECDGNTHIYIALRYYNDNINLNITPLNTSAADMTIEQARYQTDLWHAAQNCTGLLDKNPNFINPNWITLSDERIQENSLHEIGHSLYNAAFIKNDPSFELAFQRDVAANGGVDGAYNLGLGYYVQPNGRGETEAFAEGFLASQMEHCSRTNFVEHFPHVRAWINEYLAHFDKYQPPYGAQNFTCLDRGISTADLGNVSHVSYGIDVMPHITLPPLAIAATFLFLGYVKYYDGFLGTDREYLANLKHRSATKLKDLFFTAASCEKAVVLNPRGIGERVYPFPSPP